MNFDNANRWLTLVANFAVIAGIVFLGFELHQNTQQLKTQSYQAWMAANVDINMAVTDPELSGIIATGHANSAALSHETYAAYAMLHMSLMQMAQSTHYLYLSDAIDEELWRAEISRAAGILTAPGVRQWWEAGGKTQLTPTFVEFIESVDSNITWWDWDDVRGFYGIAPGDQANH